MISFLPAIVSVAVEGDRKNKNGGAEMASVTTN